MALDSVTETIAHFVGTFELTIEQARLRDQYEEFTALRRKAEVEELEDPITIRVKADLKLDPGEYDPLPYRFKTPPTEPVLPPPVDGPVQETIIVLGEPTAEGQLVPDNQLGQSGNLDFVIIQQQPEIGTHGSAVTYTMQTLTLSDNDTVGQGDFRDTETMIAEAEEALDMALSLHAMSAPSLAISDYMSSDYVEGLAEQMQTPMNSDVEGVTIHQFHGGDAMGIIVNGEHVEEAPVWSELLPEHHQPEEDAEAEAIAHLPDEWDQSEDPEFDDGHTVIVGGNLAINEVAANVAWVDAPFIAVGGQAISLTMVSQVAVVSDMDQGNAGSGSGTNVVQSAQIEVEAKAAPWLAQSTDDAEQPSFLSVDWIHGDLVVANFVKQMIDATDIDHIQTEISAASTLYAMGDNEMVNVSDLIQLGSFYDLIMIGGDMISVDMLFQTLVLMDDDVVTGGMAAGTGGGDDNLVMNQASLTTIGEDSEGELNDNLTEAMALSDMDLAALEEALLNDPMFAGMEQMRVLKIDGNLLQVNIVEQVTMLADQDDVHLSGPNGAETEVLSGSNAMLNAANITKIGVDSTVMAAGGTYSDLLLHQASLIEMPENEESEELANEAIALLMEESAGVAGQAGMGTQGPQLTPSEMLSPDDGLQSMLV
ncbi:type I secretion protein [Ruegeria arenilitoris]|uniref:type I secretion protein n=1 Tax=Ruegeria arenilitoris TaxID=1173585 RepID=UPI001481530D|nr:type I secretion protein [Ruegeria arenilitoris]